MDRVNTMTKAFLLFCALGIIPIGLGYGAVPDVTMGALFGIEVDSTNLTHIFRAVMGLYLAMGLLWLLGAFRPALTKSALVSVVVFMFGLAAGRILSLLVDGLPHVILIVYLALEIALGAIAVQLLRKRADRSRSEPGH